MDTRRAVKCAASGRFRPTTAWRQDQGWHVLARYPAAIIVALAVVSILVLAACATDASTGGTIAANDGGSQGSSASEGGSLADGSFGDDGGSLADGSLVAGDGGFLSDGSLPAPDSSDYQSAPPPEGPTGGDDTSDDPLPVNDTGVVLVAGNHLYYLNQHRGLLVFDVTTADQPVLVGNSPTSGDPQALYANGNQVVAVLADEYGTTALGAPFHGSVARVLDCSDPAHIQLVGEVQVRGYVQDSRLVGGVLYTVGTDRDMPYGAAWQGGTSNPYAVITSIGLSSSPPKKIAEQTVAGDHGVFAFASGALLASTYDAASSASTLQYVDISDAAGAIALRGATTVSGETGESEGYCSNSGGWMIDFADGVHAHSVNRGGTTAGDDALTTVDFSNPDAPVVSSILPGLLHVGDEQGIVARFQVDPTGGSARLYVAHSANQGSSSTALDVYDLSNPASPQLVGQTSYAGDACATFPSGDQLVTVSSFGVSNATGLDVQGIDVSNPTAPKLLGAAMLQANHDLFPSVEAPAQVAIDATGALAAVPVTINPGSGPYINGVEVLTLGNSTLGPAGLASVAGAMQRALFVGDRLYAITDQTLDVFDVSSPASPRATGQVTFAPWVVAVQPAGSSVVELSSNLVASSPPPTDVRIVPAAGANDMVAWNAATTAALPDSFPQAFPNGPLVYVATSNCGYAGCSSASQEVTVIDTSSGAPVKRGWNPPARARLERPLGLVLAHGLRMVCGNRHRAGLGQLACHPPPELSGAALRRQSVQRRRSGLVQRPCAAVRRLVVGQSAGAGRHAVRIDVRAPQWRLHLPDVRLPRRLLRRPH